IIRFLCIGERLLMLVGIDVNSVGIVGASELFFPALEIIQEFLIYKDEAPETASIAPLAFPLIAGPGVMTTILALRAEYEVINLVFAIIINVTVVFFVLIMSSRIEKRLGKSGLSVIRKVFGVVLLAIAVKLFASNVKDLFV